jgi:hypothetical protein
MDPGFRANQLYYGKMVDNLYEQVSLFPFNPLYDIVGKDISWLDIEEIEAHNFAFLPTRL